MPNNKTPILSVTHLTKSFGGVKALDNVEFDLQKGEVHALMGENGAGKSTFMKTLMGLVSPDSGEITFEGNSLKNQSVQQILGLGISMIHQEILAVEELTVAQNIFLGRENNKFGWLSNKIIDQKAQEIIESLGLNIKAQTKVKNLKIAEKQMVEIAKAISNNAKIIIMDEPTSALSENEVATLFRIIRELKSIGVSIIYISHKMEEIYEIADRITVLRDGKYIATQKTKDLNEKSLINLMVGREISDIFPKSEKVNSATKPVFSVKNFSSNGKFEGINFEINAGEVLGVAGLMGAGRSEIARAIYGLDASSTGEIVINTQNISINSPKEAIINGIGYVGEDRKLDGFVPNLSIKQNLSLSSLSNYAKNWFINSDLEEEASQKMSTDLKVKPANLNQKVKNISGGNQQKVVIGKALLTNPKLLILDEPTRGIDIGAKFEIYKLINQLKDNGLAILLISSELPEIIGLSDRVMVISRGKQATILQKNEASQEKIMQYALN
jgi:inositol transport system ATP-binding protein